VQSTLLRFAPMRKIGPLGLAIFHSLFPPPPKQLTYKPGIPNIGEIGPRQMLEDLVFRIEMGAIESRLIQYPEVREAVVIAREDTPGDKRLVAYYTASTTQAALDAERLRSHLSASLPEYMVPAAYVRLESLPLTPNGKLDRKALPAPEADAYASRGYVPPLGEIETKLAAIWAEVLKLDRVGRYDNFFSLGGNSLLAVRVLTRLRQELSVEVAIRDLFAYPVLASLAKQIIVMPLEEFNSKDLEHLMQFVYGVCRKQNPTS